MTACAERISNTDSVSIRFDPAEISKNIIYYKEGFGSKLRKAVTYLPDKKKSEAKVRICEKYLLTVEEATEYFNIGRDKLRELTDGKRCPYVLYVGRKRLIKREMFSKFLDSVEDI